jgi:hypothetical protein
VLSIALALTLQACAGGDAISGPHGGAGDSGSPAKTDVAGTGAGAGMGGSGTSAGSTHDAAIADDDAGTAPPTPFDAAAAIDLSGTWISQVETPATESGPIVGDTDANLRMVFRLLFRNVGDTLEGTYEICDLTSVTTPDPKTLVVTFTPAVIATLKTVISQAAASVKVGDAAPIPKITLLSGIDTSGKSVDADADSHPGVTLPTSVGGTLSVNGYAGVTVNASFTSTLTGPDTLEGNGAVSATGIIFGSSSALITSGMIKIIPKADRIPFTATRLPGDVPCAEVLTKFPRAPRS